MAATNIAVVYSEHTGRIRRVLIPEHDDRELGTLITIKGEGVAILQLSKISIYNLDWLQETLNKITGKTPSNDRHCVVHPDGHIVAVLICDPVGCGDLVDGYHLIPHGRADNSWKYDHGNSRFIEP